MRSFPSRILNIAATKLFDMIKNVLVYGLISGGIVSTLMLVSIGFMDPSGGGMDMNTGMVVGYASMLLAFSLVFVGTRNYREKFNNGVISFGKAFKVGFLIVLVASTIYVISWLIYYFAFMPDFIDQYSDFYLKELADNGVSQAEIDKQTLEMEEFKKMYNNPFFTAIFTYMEILPIGLLVTLISSLILKRKQPKSA